MKVLSRRIIYKGIFCLLAGAALGLICSFMASIAMINWDGFWGSSIMWGVIYNRILIGFVVFGVSFINPFKKMQIKPWQRGFIVGCLVSIDLSIWFLMIDHPKILYLFFSSMIIGGVYGVIIDHYSSKYFGHRHQLVKYSAE